MNKAVGSPEGSTRPGGGKAPALGAGGGCPTMPPGETQQSRAGEPIAMQTSAAAWPSEACDLIVFDGECVLCSGFFRFMLRYDRAKRFSFATAQSALGQRLYRRQGLPTGDFETNLVYVDGRCYQRMDAFAAAMRALPWPWKLLSVCRFLPTSLKDPLYHLIARNRYRIFGRYETCMIPSPELRARFLDWRPDGG